MKSVWHVAAMGNWQEVVSEQLILLSDVGITNVDVTFVGMGLDWFHTACRYAGVKINIIKNDLNISHYETFAMLYIERLAKFTDEPIMYFHTKGVSNPADLNKVKWRKLMEDHVIRQWQQNLLHLRGNDALGVNWLTCDRPHFSGNFWIADPAWVRQLVDFTAFHVSMNFVRYSCEFWIGSKPGCRNVSLAHRDQPFWEGNWRW